MALTEGLLMAEMRSHCVLLECKPREDLLIYKSTIEACLMLRLPALYSEIPSTFEERLLS